MKHKKLLSLVLSAALCLSVAAPAMAAPGENTKPIVGENSTYIPHHRRGPDLRQCHGLDDRHR